MLGSRLFRLECSLSPKVKTLDILSIVCRIFFPERGSVKLTLLFAFELLKEITLELLKLLVLILFLALEFFFWGGEQGCIFIWLTKPLMHLDLIVFQQNDLLKGNHELPGTK